jgi:hypothetical protein
MRESLTNSQFFLKKAGPKPSGPGLELSFMEKRAAWMSSMVKRWMREEAWVVVSEVV